MSITSVPKLRIFLAEVFLSIVVIFHTEAGSLIVLPLSNLFNAMI